MINCIVVEDEPIALKKLIGFIADVPFLNLEASFSSALDALDFLNKNKVDLAYVDIHMDKLSGLQLIESLTNPPLFIITTAYNNHAIKAYELSVTDYLLKPFSFERFLSATNKACKQLNNHIDNKNSEAIFVKTSNHIERVMVDEILFIEGMKDYLGIVTTQKRIMCLQNFATLLEALPMDKFMRIHKSYVVSFKHIESISNHRVKICDKLLPISETYQKAFYNALNKYHKLI